MVEDERKKQVDEAYGVSLAAFDSQIEKARRALMQLKVILEGGEVPARGHFTLLELEGIVNPAIRNPMNPMNVSFALPLLIQGMQDDRAIVRQACVHVIEKISDAGFNIGPAIPALIDVLKGSDTEQIHCAIDALIVQVFKSRVKKEDLPKMFDAIFTILKNPEVRDAKGKLATIGHEAFELFGAICDQYRPQYGWKFTSDALEELRSLTACDASLSEIRQSVLKAPSSYSKGVPRRNLFESTITPPAKFLRGPVPHSPEGKSQIKRPSGGSQ
ncbi:hypothetical protein HZC07_06100 [Candidatus Micrarchaeota archaeon]|nr:hypothetical protein [Candidatus Micrarchaeota archaeon]